MSVAPVAKILIKIRSANATKVTTVYGEPKSIYTVRMFGLRGVNPSGGAIEAPRRGGSIPRRGAETARAESGMNFLGRPAGSPLTTKLEV